MTDNEQVMIGLQVVIIVLLAIFCALKAAADHPDWFDTEVTATEPNWHSFDYQPNKEGRAMRQER